MVQSLRTSAEKTLVAIVALAAVSAFVALVALVAVSAFAALVALVAVSALVALVALVAVSAVFAWATESLGAAFLISSAAIRLTSDLDRLRFGWASQKHWRARHGHPATGPTIQSRTRRSPSHSARRSEHSAEHRTRRHQCLETSHVQPPCDFPCYFAPRGEYPRRRRGRAPPACSSADATSSAARFASLNHWPSPWLSR